MYLGADNSCTLVAGGELDRAAGWGVDDPVEVGAVFGGVGDGAETARGFEVAAFELAEFFAGAPDLQRRVGGKLDFSKNGADAFAL